MKFMIAVGVAFGVGFGCRWFDIPAPAPPVWQGALLVVAVTLGYSGAGWVKDRTQVPESRVVAPAPTAETPSSTGEAGSTPGEANPR